ncbi:MAG: hypothetical protein ABSC94_24175 [Polyangiaceae bacterium]|jgi:hypothetical protein
MTVEEFRQLLIAPEIIVLDVADAALLALERALVLEHPMVNHPARDDDPIVRRRARRVLREADRLLRVLRAYRYVVHAILLEALRQEPTDPF